MKATRHTLIYLTSNAPLVDNNSYTFHYQKWISAGFPFIIPRQPEHYNPKQLTIALPLYDSSLKKKYRLQYKVNRENIKKMTLLPHMMDIFPGFNCPNKEDIHVYGSYAWQYLSKKTYVTNQSDLDIMITYQGQSSSDLYNLINHIKNELTIDHIDGELRLNTLGDCSLHELLSDSKDILFKTLTTVRFVKRHEIYQHYSKLAY